VFQQINLAVWSWAEAMRLSGKGRLWLPFCLFFAFQILLMALLVSFANPLLSWLLVPIMRTAFGDFAVHYPMNLVVLGPMFAGSNLVVGILAWALMLGMAIVLFATAYQGSRVTARDAMRLGRMAYGDVLLTQIPLTVLVAVLVFVTPKFIPIHADSPGMLIRLQRYGTVLAGIMIEALFVTAPMYVLLEGRRAGAALRKAMSFSVRNAPAVLLLVALPALVHVPMGFLARRWRTIIEKGSPELLIAIVAGDVLLYVITNFILVGGVTRYYLARRA
jgi:hypothetical protein